MLQRFLFALICMSCFTMTAVADGDAQLVGDWSGIGGDGVLTQLHFDANGNFTLREQHSRDLRRAYLCGSYDLQGDVLDLSVQLRKERTADGIVEQAAGEQRESLVIESRSANSLVVRIAARTVVLSRAG